MFQLNLTYFTKNIYKSSYPAISPTNPILSARGKAILITAGASGIGFAIAEAFAAASASHLILLSRRESALKEASDKLTSAYPNTKIHTYACSVVDSTAIDEVFTSIKTQIGNLDIVISSACNIQSPCTGLQTPLSHTKETFDTVVLGGVNVINAFLTTFPPSKTNEKTFINVSSCSAHVVIPMQTVYAGAKAAFATMLQHYHADHAKEGLNIYSFHPGGIYTDAVKEYGIPEKALEWDDASLPGGFALWLSSDEAKFLRGRFLWSCWDVEELKGRREEIENDKELLTMGLMVGGHQVYKTDEIIVQRASDKTASSIPN